MVCFVMLGLPVPSCTAFLGAWDLPSCCGLAVLAAAGGRSDRFVVCGLLSHTCIRLEGGVDHEQGCGAMVVYDLSELPMSLCCARVGVKYMCCTMCGGFMKALWGQCNAMALVILTVDLCALGAGVLLSTGSSPCSVQHQVHWLWCCLPCICSPQPHICGVEGTARVNDPACEQRVCRNRGPTSSQGVNVVNICCMSEVTSHLKQVRGRAIAMRMRCMAAVTCIGTHMHSPAQIQSPPPVAQLQSTGTQGLPGSTKGTSRHSPSWAAAAAYPLWQLRTYTLLCQHQPWHAWDLLALQAAQGLASQLTLDRAAATLRIPQPTHAVRV
jgi:hypothetical protein